METVKKYSTAMLAFLFLFIMFHIQGCGFMKSRISSEKQPSEYTEPEVYSEKNIQESSSYPNETKELDSACMAQVQALERELTQKQDQMSALQDTVRFLEKKTASLEGIIAKKEADMARMKKASKASSQPEYRKVIPQQPKVKKASKPMSARALYQNSRKFLLNKQYKNAVRGFSSFITKYPAHDLADNSLYWLGETYYTQEKYKKAIHHFQTLLEKYPRGEKMPDALLKAGYAYMALGNTDTAKQYFTRLLKNYPFAPAAQKAQTKLDSLQ